MLLALSLLALALTSTPAQIIIQPAPTATLDAETADWLPGTMKHFRAEWHNFQAGDPYVIFMTDVFQRFGEGYDFLIKSGTVPTTDGVLEFDANFPTSEDAMNPDYSPTPLDGRHSAVFYGPNNGAKGWSPNFRLILNDVHLEAFGQKPFNARLGDVIWPFAVYVDAQYSPTDILSVELPIVLWADSAELVVHTALFDGDRQVSSEQVLRPSGGDKGKYAKVTFDTHNFNVPKGTYKLLTMKAVAKKGYGMFGFAIDLEIAPHSFGPRGQSLSTAVGWQGGPDVTLVGSKH